MKLMPLEYTQAKEAALQMPFAWIRFHSGLYIGSAPNPWDEEEELAEARFFDGTSEIRFFRVEDTLRAALVSAEEGDAVVYRSYRPDNPKFGRRITIATLLAPDADGQMNPAAVFLSGWEGGGDHAQ